MNRVIYCIESLLPISINSFELKVASVHAPVAQFSTG